MKKGLVATLMSLCLLVGLLPISAFAVDETSSDQSPETNAAPRSAWAGDENSAGTKEKPWDISYEDSGNDVEAYLIQNDAGGDNPTYTCYITGTGKAATYSIDYDRLPPWWKQVNQITKVVVEDGITYIYDDGFSGAELLTDVELPSSLEYLGDYFSECPALTSITFPDGAPGRWWLGARAFQNCTALKEFPFEGVWKIGMYAFQGSGVADVLLPDVEEIDTNAFQARDLRRVFIQSETIDEVLSGAFSPRYDKSWESIIYVMNDNVADLLTTASGDRNFNPYKTIIANLNGGEFADGYSYADEGTVLPRLDAKDGKAFLGWYIAGTNIKLPNNQAMKDSDGDWYRVEAKWAEDSGTTDIGDIGLFMEDPGYSAIPATVNDIVTVDHVTVTDVQWTVNGHPMDTAAGFQTGESYTITVTVQLKDGYTFTGNGYISDGDDNLLTETKMAKMSVTNQEGNIYQLSYTFPNLSNEQTYQIYDKYENVFQYNRLEVEHGNISHSGGPFKAGTEVILTANPEKGYGMDTPPVIRRYTDRSVKVPVTSLGNNKYSFIMPDYVVTVEDPVFVMQTYTITYEGLEGAEYDETSYPDTYTIETQPTLPNPTKEGVYFAGWEVNHAGYLGHLAAQGDYKIDDAENLVLTARWKSSNGLTIHVESFGGSEPVEDVFLSDEVLWKFFEDGDDSGISLPDLSTAPELEGYEFLFWHLDYMDFAQYMDEYIENREEALADLGEMREVYEDMLSSGNLGEAGVTEEQVRTILDVIGLGEYTWDHVLLLGDAAETSESFGTWYETIQSTGMADYLINKYLYEAEYSGKGLPVWYYPAYARVVYGAELSELTIYATYLKDDSIVDHYQLTYESNGGTAYDVENYLDGTTATLDKTPTKSGYDFTGWYADTGLTQKVASITMDSNKTIYADWTPQSTDPGGTTGDSSSSGSSSVKYSISAEAGVGGTISPNGSISVIKGSDKTFTITANKGYEITDVLVDGESVGAVRSYTFENVKANHTISVTFEEGEQVIDPDETGVSDWLNTADHIVYLNGYMDGTFRPDDNMTRAEVAQMFYNLLNDKDVAIAVSFSDVASDAWYAEAVNTLASLGMITGVGDNKYEPDRSITRAEFTAIAMRFADLATGGENVFSDVAEDAWYHDYVVGSIKYGWITGYPDGTFRPENTITRAEVTTIVNRMLGRSADRTFIAEHADELRSFSDVATSHWSYYAVMEATNAHDFTKDNGVETWNGLSD